MVEATITTQTGRLDKVLTTIFPQYSRSQIQQLLEQGNILVNETLQKGKYKVKAGDKISLTEPAIKELEVEPENIALDIVYEEPYRKSIQRKPFYHSLLPREWSFIRHQDMNTIR